MNKKYFSYIIISVLCLNLLPQTSNAFMLNETKTDVIYDEEDEKEEWEKIYLPHAIHSKLVGRNATVLDIAKMADKEREDENLLADIMNLTDHDRSKMLVKWERDNGYIDEEGEKTYEISPLGRRKLLLEIEEEEKKIKAFRWKSGKADLKVGAFAATLAISRWLAKDWGNAGKYATFALLTISTAADVIEAGGGWIWSNTIKRLWKSKDDEEIELPPLRNLPVIPADHERVDVYSYGL